MHFLLSRYFAVLGICVFLPWVSSSVLDTIEPETILSTEVLPNSTSHSTVAPTTNNVTHTTFIPTTINVTHTTFIPTTINVTHTTFIPTTINVTHTTSNVTHTTVIPTTNNVTHTTVSPNSTHAPVTNHSTVEPTGTTKHGEANVTSHVTAANGSTATFAPTANHTSVASTIVITTPTSSGGKSSQFDPASFLGGIVLMLGLSVIAFISYRCYRNRRSSTPPYRVVDE